MLHHLGLKAAPIYALVHPGLPMLHATPQHVGFQGLCYLRQ
jgi:hypothetical protein